VSYFGPDLSGISLSPGAWWPNPTFGTGSTPSGQVPTVSSVPVPASSSTPSTFDNILKVLGLGLQGWQIYNANDLASQALNQNRALAFDPVTGKPLVNTGATYSSSGSSIGAAVGGLSGLLSSIFPILVVLIIVVVVLRLLK
jgi:hypothetical protein